MPNIASAKKRVRVTKNKTIRNKIIKSNVKTVIKTAMSAINNNGENKSEVVRFAMKRLDQAGSKGVFHKNKVANAKSKLQRAFNLSLSK